MEKRYTTKTNALRIKLLMLAFFTLLLGGKTALARNWQTWDTANDQDERVYYLITDPENPEQFYVYYDNMPDPNAYGDIGPYTNIKGREIGNNSNGASDNRIKIVFCTTHPVKIDDGWFKITANRVQLSFELGSVDLTSLTFNGAPVTSYPELVPFLSDTYTTTSFTYDSEVTLEIGSNFSFDNVYRGIFTIDQSSTVAAADRQLIFKGLPTTYAAPNDTLPEAYAQTTKRQFVIDGGSTVSASNGTCTLSGNPIGGTLFRVNCGTLILENVTVKNFWASVGNSCGGVALNNTNSSNQSLAVSIDHCQFTNCAGTYPCIQVQHANTNANSTASTVLNKCRIENCVSATASGAIQDNAAIRSNSKNKSTLDVYNCVVRNNHGGGVRWQSLPPRGAVFQNCTIENNYKIGDGGGMLIKSTADIKGCVIRNNYATRDGGGIYFSTFEERQDDATYDRLVPKDGIVVLDANTRIDANTAGRDGGGLAVFAQLIHPRQKYYYYSFDGNNETTNQLQVGVRVEGATITGNTATSGSGGGIYISRETNATCYGTSALLKYGLIENNTAAANGGGVAIVGAIQDEVEAYNDANHGPGIPANTAILPQDITVEIGAGKEGDDTKDMKIQGNTAQNGGGVYVEGYPIAYHEHTSEVNTTLYAHAFIQNGNSAFMNGSDMTTGNGGGLYMKKGTVYFHDCTIQENVAYNDGGGVYVDNGDITTAIRTLDEVSHTPDADPNVIDGKYKIVDYIRATNTNSNFINTGIAAKPTHTIWAHGERATNESTFLYAYLNSNNRLGTRFLSGAIQYFWRKGGTGTSCNNNINYSTLGLSSNNDHRDFVWAMNKSQQFIKDGAGNVNNSHKIHFGDDTDSSIGVNWLIFKGQNNTTSTVTLYEAKIWEGTTSIDPSTGEVTGGTLIAHFVPCYKISDGKIGVLNMAKYNASSQNSDDCFIQGTGSFAIPTGSKGDDWAGNGVSNGSAASVLAGATNGTREVSGCTIKGNIAQNDGGGIYLNNGGIFLTNTIIEENFAVDSCGGGVYNHEGNIHINFWDASDPTYGTNYTVRGETTASQIKNNVAGRNGGGINTHSGRIFIRGQNPSQDIEVLDNTALLGSGGGVFCMGDSEDNTAEQIRLINVNMIGNKAKGTGTSTHDGITTTNGCGGGIYLQHGIINVTKTELQGNYAQQNGGGINNHGGTINVSGCIVGGNTYYDNGAVGEGNKAEGNGGGIYTQTGDINISNHYDSGLNDYITQICHNLAGENGGGINTHSGKVVATGEYTDDRTKNILIENNMATNGSGGGIFCMGDGTGTFANPDLKLTFASLFGNQAQNGTGTTGAGDVTTGCGGAMYLHNGTILVTDADMEGNFANHNGGAINNHNGNIYILGSMVGGNTYYNNGVANEGNKANHNGGGIYTNHGNVDIRDYTENLQGTVRHLESKVTYNQAGENGGGINTHSGTITVNFDEATGKERETDHQIEISYNKAKQGGGIYANAGTIITANTNIDNNLATENGGGMNNHAGSITMYGGTLNNNTAQDGMGGGAFTMVGDIDILPFPVEITNPTLNAGTKIYNNLAKLNGGGLNNHTGRIDIRHARLKNNTSKLGNGGGIFCEGPHTNATGFTIRLLCSELIQNKTRGQDGTEAEPTGRGGGIYLKYGSIYAHASDILLNSANINGGGIDNHQGNMLLYGCTLDGNTAVTGRGGAIYTHAGDITTGPCIDRDDSSKSRATLIQHNTAKINGGGINNHQGNIYLNGDHILHNTAEEGNGGGIYIASGQIDMFGGKMAFNTAGNDGGGVWSGGGNFNINKRQGKPIVEIVDVDVTGANTATVHYHIIDKGNSNIAAHGIQYGTTNPTTSISNGQQAGSEDGCWRINITGLTAGTTYYVTAFATNSTLTNRCDTLSFTTYSNLPVVITGSVNEVTATHAEVYAKLVYDGGSPVSERGVVCGPTEQDITEPLTSNAVFFQGSSDEFFLTEITNNNYADPGATVYCRAYAINANGTGYGEIITFVTPKDVPVMNGALSIEGYELESNNKYKYTFKYTMATSGLTAYGFVISTDNEPELNVDHTIPGDDGTSFFTGTATGLEGGTTYYVSAYASKSDEEPAAKDITNYAFTTPMQFITPDAAGKPVVRANDITGITRTSATISGEIVHTDDPTTISRYGVVYSTTNSEPAEGGTDCSINQVSASLDAGDAASGSLTGLTPNTTYYVRLFAENNQGIGYSNPFSFTTLPINPPIVEVNVHDIGQHSAIVTVTVDPCGAALKTGLTDYGIQWKVDGGSYETKYASGYDSSTGTFSVTLNETTVPTSGLASDTKYWVKAFCSNATGTANDGSGDTESREVSFTTLYSKPIVDGVTIDSIYYVAVPVSHHISVYGNATAGEASQPVQKFGFIYSTRNNATIHTISSEYLEEAVEVGAGNMGSVHLCDLTNKLGDNREYWVKAYASAKANPTSDDDYSYGMATKVLTLPRVNRTTDNPSTTHESAQLPAKIYSYDESHFLQKYGICWVRKTEAGVTPTVDDDHVERDITSTPMDFSLNTSEAVAALPAGEYYWRAYVKNTDYTSASPYKGVAYTSDGVFRIHDYGITTEAVPAGSATITGGGYYDNPSPAITLTATGSNSLYYEFEKWTKTIPGETETQVSTTNPYNITAGTAATAHYKAYYKSKVTVIAGTGGKVRFGTSGTLVVTDNAMYSYNRSCTVNAVANEGYIFQNWTDANGEVVETADEYTFDVIDVTTLTANFILDDSKGTSTSYNSTSPRPRDIYPAPAREPWDWDDEWVETVCTPSLHEDDTLTEGEADEERTVRERLSRNGVVEPENIPLIQSNEAKRGGGIFMAEKASPTAPAAKLLFTGGANASEQGKIIFNYASESGGGIYIDSTAMMHMKGHCLVNANHVPEGMNGGGIYLSGRLYVGELGTTSQQNGLIVNKNFAIGTEKASFDSTAFVTDASDYTNSHKDCLNNVCLTRHTYDYDHSTQLGTYDDESTVITLLSDISGKDPGTGEPYSNIGFHVTEGFCPVIATSYEFGKEYAPAEDNNSNYFPTGQTEYDLDEYEQWLQNIMESSVSPSGLFSPSSGAIFEDTESYVAIHTRNAISAPFNSKYIYLWGCWTHPAVKVDPETKNPMTNEPSTPENFLGHYKIVDKTDGILTWEIYSEEGLSWFSSYINGLSVFAQDAYNLGAGDLAHKDYEYDPNKTPYAKAVLMNDLDLAAHFWVPIGSVTIFNANNIQSGLSGSGEGSLFDDLTDESNPHHFAGSFDGQGHVIKGIDCRYLSGIYKLGLFGYLDEGAEVKNVFVDNARIEATDASKGFHIGGIAGKAIGTVSLSGAEARAIINTSSAKKDESYVGGLIGQTVGDDNKPTIIHSSMAMPEITGVVDYMGGLVGQLGTYDELYNSFSNPKFNSAPDSDKYIGGLVGVNDGKVENCYTRLRGIEQSNFAYVAGTNNNEKIKYTYIPAGQSNYVGTGYDPSGHGTYTATVRYSGKYGFNHRDHNIEANNNYVKNDTLIGGLQRALNAWVKDADNNGWNAATGTNDKGYAIWTRTMASPINDDYPVLQFAEFNAVGSEDSIYMHYRKDVNEMIAAYKTLNNTDYPTPAIYLYDTIKNGNDPVHITETNVGSNVMLAINEKVGILQDVELFARVGVTFDNSNGLDLPELGGQPYDWHMFSSALKAAPMGLEYYDDATAYPVQANYASYSVNGISETDYASFSIMDPPRTTWYQSDDEGGLGYDPSRSKIGYFPTNTPYGASAYRGSVGAPANASGSFDFYCFNEEYRHWINFKRQGREGFYDHWYQDAKNNEETPPQSMHYNIEYTNESQFLPGKGYMMGVSAASMLMADGLLNNGSNIEATVTNSSYTHNPSSYAEDLRGTNIVGNPYQSYLDFDLFAAANNSIMTNAYYVFDADSLGYLCYPARSSANPLNASRYINPHQGFIVMVKGDADSTVETQLEFNNNMRCIAGNNDSHFRDGNLNYPLVNLLCYDSDGKRDATTVEINRPDNGGGLKLKKLRSGKMLLYARQDNQDYQTVFTPVGTNTVPVRFQVFEDGVYTMKWQTFHGDFSYLHLIDNITGADVDCLSANEYRFEASTSDYLSRFKLVFDCTGVDEFEDEEPTGSATFAFQMGEELVVNGEGTIQLFDLNGRCLVTKQIAGGQGSISLPNVASGIYLLRLANSKQVRTQKIVISH